MAEADWYEPRSRFWHSAELVGGNVIVRGGCIPGIDNKKERKEMLKNIEIFDIKTRKWRSRKTKGDRHPGLSSVACVSYGKYLYAYGGLDGTVLNGVLSELNLETLAWTQLSPKTSAGPMRKDASGIVHFGDGLLAVVCGYAYPNKPKLPNGGSSDLESTFILRRGSPNFAGGGWTNEIHIFDIGNRAWSTNMFKGSRPPPCADFALISIDEWRAVVYGGRRGTDHDSKDLYIINFSDMKITKVQPDDKKDPWPTIRLGQQATCCFGFDTKYVQLLMTGGRLRQQLPLQDMWLFDLKSSTWKEVKIPDKIRSHLGRWGHTTTTITHAAGLVEVLMFGGCTRLYEVVWEVKIDEDYSSLAVPLSFIFGFLHKEWKLLDIVSSNSSWDIVTSFDLDGKFTLGALYSMEQDGIPVLTELIDNSRTFHSVVCRMATDKDSIIYKWPTLHAPSPYEPTWKKLCSILQLNDKEELAEDIKRYLEKKRVPPATTNTEMDEKVDTREIDELEGQISTLSVEDSTSGLRGVEVCGETQLTITNAAYEFVWEGYGLRLHIQENSLPSGMEKITLNIAASIAGHYEFPENSHLVSAVYWFRCNPWCKLFEKQITVEIQHCGKTDNTPKLSFVRAVCTQEHLPYNFNHVAGGRFTSHSSYGVLKMSRFSGVSVVQSDSEHKEYYAKLFYFSQETIHIDIHFVVTMNTEVHHTVVERDYRKKRAQSGPKQVVEFESDRISLDIPMEGTGDLKGWKIFPLMRPVVLKKEVDRFIPGKEIPQCQLRASVVDQSKQEPLYHIVNLEGAKDPHNVFTIHIDDYPHTDRPRSASDPAVSPATTKEQREEIQKSHSWDAGTMSIIREEEMRDASTSNPPRVPTIKTLTVLKWRNDQGNIERFQTKKQIFHKWRDMGNVLEIEWQVLEDWQNNKRSSQECCDAVIHHWLNNPTEEYPATWEGLYELLEDCELGTVASKLKRAVEGAI